MHVQNFSMVVSELGQEQGQRHPVYANICGAVANLTAAILEANLSGVLTPTVASSLHDFLGGVQDSLEKHMTES